MGLTQARLKEINPDLIVVSVNGYGSSGPYADRPAFDFIAQAMSGYMATNGTPDTGPMRTAPPITDLVAGLYAALGAVAALRGRENGGPAQRVEASMMMSMMSMMAYLSSNALATGRDPVPTGNDHPIASPYGLFRASDGDIAVAPSTEVIVRRFLTELGLAHLLSEPAFENNAMRLQNRAALNARINAALAHDTQDAWITRLNKAGVPSGRVQSLTEALSDPQVAAQDMVLRVPHPGHGDVAMTGFPIKFSQTPLSVRHPTPDLGAQGRDILRAAGYKEDEIDALIAKGVMGAGPAPSEATSRQTPSGGG
jgi:crotonobetainyl-CoA:carnitine CoA-transferase CaiB-like acyl-CoA transferase